MNDVLETKRNQRPVPTSAGQGVLVRLVLVRLVFVRAAVANREGAPQPRETPSQADNTARGTGM